MNLLIFVAYLLFILIYFAFFAYAIKRFLQIRIPGDRIPLILIIFSFFVAGVIILSIISFLIIS